MDIANILIKYFANIGSVLYLGYQGDTLPVVTPPNPPMLELYEFRPTNVQEIVSLIKKLNSKSAAGFDGINSCEKRFIGNCSEFGVYDRFPDELKIARVVLIHKGGKKSDPNKYRAISILLTFSNIFEMIIKDRIIEPLKYLNFINENQFGFQEFSNTNTACLNLIEQLYNNIDKKLKTGGLFIDVRKAFDSVNHTILLCKLNEIGFRGNCLSLLKSYLTNRKQFINMNGINSDDIQLKCGVPQGSILGPLLLLILTICSIATSTALFSFSPMMPHFYMVRMILLLLN